MFFLIFGNLKLSFGGHLMCLGPETPNRGSSLDCELPLGRLFV